MIRAIDGVRAHNSRSWLQGAMWVGVAVAWSALIAWAYHRAGGGDIAQVWLAAHLFVHGYPPYTDPLFVYPPSALVPFVPFGFIGLSHARLGFTVLDGATVLLAAGLSLRLFGVSLRSRRAPVICLVFVFFAPVFLTLHLANVTGLVAAGEAAALLAAARGHWSASGWLLGLTLAIKPVLAPLLLIPLLWRQWGTLARAVALPIGVSAVALPFVAGGSQFFSSTLPFLLKGGAQNVQTVNVSIRGAAALIGMPTDLTLCLRVLVVGMCLYLLVVRFRRDDVDEASRLADCSALILVAAFLGFSFSWNNYPLLLMPALVGIAVGRSAAPRWTLWAPLVLFGGPDVFLWRHAAGLAPYATARVTVGLILLIGGFGVTLVGVARRREIAVPRSRAGFEVT